MRYWDTSVVVPLLIEEARTEGCLRAAGAEPIVTWCLSSVEAASAIERQAREGKLDEQARADALRGLDTLARSWTEVAALSAVRERALRVIAVHRLRAGDALQLGAALVAVADRPSGHEFFCGEHRLLDAAAREGFTALSP